VLLGRGFFRERPREHELGFEHRAAAFDDPVQGRSHPADHRMPDPALDIFDNLPGRALEPSPIELLGREPQLDEKVIGQVFRLRLASFFPPEAL
jgi:hypothetical protein